MLGDETEESFKWALTQMKNIAEESRINDPYVAVSDYDRAFRNAHDQLYPQTSLQLCRWHVMKNVLYNVRVKWDGVLDGTAVAAGMGGQGSQIRDQQNQDEQNQDEADNAAETQTNGMVNEQDRAARNGGNNSRSLPAPSREQGREEEGYTQDADGLLCA